MYRISHLKKKNNSFLLDIPEFQIENGACYSIIGPNGSGKSTLFDVISLLVKPDSGNITFDSSVIGSPSGKELLKQRRRISYLQQNPFVFSLSVFDNIAYGLKIRKMDKNLINRKVEKVMEELKLSHLNDRKNHELSGGEKQRIAFARHYILDADLYLFDEPTANVDVENIHLIEEKIIELNQHQKKTILLSTHSKSQAFKLSSKVLSMMNGRFSETLYENIFTGDIIKMNEDLSQLEISEDSHIVFPTKNIEGNSISIHPEDIILSNDYIESSARNCLKGSIVKIEKQNSLLNITIDIGAPIVALVTEKSFNQLALNINKEIWVTFKASSVHIL